MAQSWKRFGSFCGVFHRNQGVFDSKGESHPEIHYYDWVVKLMFLADIAAHPNELNNRLKGAGHMMLSL